MNITVVLNIKIFWIIHIDQPYLINLVLNHILRRTCTFRYNRTLDVLHHTLCFTLPNYQLYLMYCVIAYTAALLQLYCTNFHFMYFFILFLCCTIEGAPANFLPLFKHNVYGCLG